MIGLPTLAKALVGKKLLDRYLVRSWTNNGHFSEVFESEDETVKGSVAVKVLKPGSNSVDVADFDLEREMLDHLVGASNVVDLVDHGEFTWKLTDPQSGNTVEIPLRFLILEWADASLADLVADRARLSWSDRLLLLRGVVKGMLQCHRGGVVHRDAKSENILVFPAHRRAEAKLADFGRGRFLNRDPRSSPELYRQGRGDIRFAPPEFLWAAAGDNDESWLAADLYSLGSVLFELGTGIGVTSLVFDHPSAIQASMLKKATKTRETEFHAALPAIRAEYETAFDLLEAELPPSVRVEAMQFVRVLCDPDPAKRRPQRIGSAPTAVAVGEWALRRIDILMLQLSIAERQAADLEEKRERRRRRDARQGGVKE